MPDEHFHSTKGRRHSPRHPFPLHPERRRQLAQPLRLIGERRGRRRVFLDERRVLLRYFIHLRDGEAHFLDAVALLLRSRRYLADDLRNPRNRCFDLANRVARARRDLRAVRDARRRIRDQHADLFRRRGRTLREAAHLARDDGETAPFLARARRFDGRVSARILV